MALVSVPGAPLVPIGPGFNTTQGVPFFANVTVDAANEAAIFFGHVLTSDGGSHTIDTTGSSSLGWRTGSVTFANAGTTLKVGLSDAINSAGPPVRAANVADVISFDVSASLTGGGGGVTGSAWQTHAPGSGSKTIANGDLVCFSAQLTARGGSDSVQVFFSGASSIQHRPAVVGFTGGAYGVNTGVPTAIITFADGALGYFQASDVLSAITVRTYNSGSAAKEYGQLYDLPFPCTIYGIYGWVDPDNDFDVVLYSDPLGTPVAEKTVTIDANMMASATGRRFSVAFATPYSVTTANQKVAAILKPGASNISAYYKTFANAAHRITDPYGTTGYGVARASGAFAAENSNLDNYYIGLLVGAFDSGASAGGMVVHPGMNGRLAA